MGFVRPVDVFDFEGRIIDLTMIFDDDDPVVAARPSLFAPVTIGRVDDPPAEVVEAAAPKRAKKA